MICIKVYENVWYTKYRFITQNLVWDHYRKDPSTQIMKTEYIKNKLDGSSEEDKLATTGKDQNSGCSDTRCSSVNF